MNNLETLKNELISQKQILESKNYAVEVVGTNPSPSEITNALNGVMINDENLNLYGNYYRVMADPSTTDYIINDMVFPSGVVSIRQYFTEGIGAHLTGKLTLPESVTEIGSRAFYETSINEINFPSNLQTINGYAFRYCSNVTKVNMPDTVTSLGNCAFEGLTELTELHISTGLTTLANTNFRILNKLTSLEIPEQISSIGLNFYTCPALENLYFKNDSMTIPISSVLGTHNENLKIWVNFTGIGKYAKQTNCAKFLDHFICQYEISTETTFPTTTVSLNWFASVEDASNSTNILSAPNGAGTYYCKIAN